MTAFPHLFHATHQTFSPGQTVQASSPTTFYPAVVQLLEAYRPGSLPSRSVCVFASDSKAGATRYLQAQSQSQLPMQVYQVEMKIGHRAPFRLIRELDIRLGAQRPITAVVAEYWMPRKNWAFWEVFGPAFTVIAQVQPATLIEMSVFNLAYDKDLELGGSL